MFYPCFYNLRLIRLWRYNKQKTLEKTFAFSISKIIAKGFIQTFGVNKLSPLYFFQLRSGNSMLLHKKIESLLRWAYGKYDDLWMKANNFSSKCTSKEYIRKQYVAFFYRLTYGFVYCQIFMRHILNEKLKGVVFAIFFVKQLKS